MCPLASGLIRVFDTGWVRLARSLVYSDSEPGSMPWRVNFYSKAKAAKPTKPKRFRGPRTTLHGEVLERDKVRDKVDEMLSGMRQDFIFARLRPACALCRNYFMGHTDDDKVRFRESRYPGSRLVGPVG